MRLFLELILVVERTLLEIVAATPHPSRQLTARILHTHRRTHTHAQTQEDKMQCSADNANQNKFVQGAQLSWLMWRKGGITCRPKCARHRGQRRAPWLPRTPAAARKCTRRRRASLPLPEGGKDILRVSDAHRGERGRQGEG